MIVPPTTAIATIRSVAMIGATAFRFLVSSGPFNSELVLNYLLVKQAYSQNALHYGTINETMNCYWINVD